MSAQFLQRLKSRAGHLAYGSPLYRWRLQGDVPDRLIVRPVDVWQGDAEAGRALCEGVLYHRGQRVVLDAGCWGRHADVGFQRYLHGFSWLRDLRSYANLGRSAQFQEAAFCGQGMIAHWIRHNKDLKTIAFRPVVLGERISHWISFYEFFAENQPAGLDEEAFLEQYFEALVFQARHLQHMLCGALPCCDLDAFYAHKGLLYAGLALEGHEVWIEQALEGIERAISKQILGDGAHISRQAHVLLEAFQILLDVRGALAAGGYPLPEAILHAIDKIGPALAFFRYPDREFGSFHGAYRGNGDAIQAVFSQSGVRLKALDSLPCGGYERVRMGRTHVMFDCGAPAMGAAAGAADGAHYAPLSFEMAYARERLFVNCGTHLTDANWREALCAGSAHNTLVIDYRNAGEMRGKNAATRKAFHVVGKREDAKDACLLEGLHDGYVPLCGLEHRRRLYMAKNGHHILGEDVLSGQIAPQKRHDFTVRFHLHPRVRVSLIQDGQEALLRLPSGLGWRFRQKGGALALEDSVCVADGIRPEKTKQLVIYGQIDG
ncbi:MAG: heparinase II/III family protein, partial [Bdellovibrionales bacterium]